MLKARQVPVCHNVRSSSAANNPLQSVEATVASLFASVLCHLTPISAATSLGQLDIALVKESQDRQFQYHTWSCTWQLLSGSFPCFVFVSPSFLDTDLLFGRRRATMSVMIDRLSPRPLRFRAHPRTEYLSPRSTVNNEGSGKPSLWPCPSLPTLEPMSFGRRASTDNSERWL